MPMLMLKCKTCGIVFSAIYIPDMVEFRENSKSDSNLIHSCSRGHSNHYLIENYIDLSWISYLHVAFWFVIKICFSIQDSKR